MLTGFPKFGELLTIGDIAFRLFVAVFVGAVIGIDREMKNRPAGMRTHVLVGVGAALIAIIEQQTIGLCVGAECQQSHQRKCWPHYIDCCIRSWFSWGWHHCDE